MARPHVMVDWEGRRRPRREVILELHREGIPKREIANRLGVIYQVVQQVIGPTGPQVRKAGAPQRADGARPIASPPPDDVAPVDVILLGCVKTRARGACRTP